jgi:uncharacterized coiled-coil DUF342 family protein
MAEPTLDERIEQLTKENERLKKLDIAVSKALGWCKVAAENGHDGSYFKRIVQELEEMSDETLNQLLSTGVDLKRARELADKCSGPDGPHAAGHYLRALADEVERQRKLVGQYDDELDKVRAERNSLADKVEQLESDYWRGWNLKNNFRDLGDLS